MADTEVAVAFLTHATRPRAQCGLSQVRDLSIRLSLSLTLTLTLTVILNSPNPRIKHHNND